MCKHQRTLLTTAANDSCAVTVLQKRETLPSVCDTILVKLPHTVWTQLANSTWIYFAPHFDIITVLPHDGNPVGVSLKVVGKLQVHPGSKGYGTTTILYSSSMIGNISTQIKGDLLSQVTFRYDLRRVRDPSQPQSLDCGSDL